MAVEERKQIPLRMPLADFVRFAALAARDGVSFNEWVVGALMERAKRVNGEKAVAPVQNKPSQGMTPARQVRVTTAGVGRLGTLESEEIERQRQAARDLAQRSGKCTADVERGVRCRLCGKMH